MRVQFIKNIHCANGHSNAKWNDHIIAPPLLKA